MPESLAGAHGSARFHEVEADTERQEEEEGALWGGATSNQSAGMGSAAFLLFLTMMLSGCVLWIAATSEPAAVWDSLQSIMSDLDREYHNLVWGSAGGGIEPTLPGLPGNRTSWASSTTGPVWVVGRTSSRTTTSRKRLWTTSQKRFGTPTQTTTVRPNTTATTTTMNDKEACGDCGWALMGTHCNTEADDGSRCWRVCCQKAALPNLIDFRPGLAVDKLQWGRCALVGASDILRSRGHGPEIDGHDMVIRVNRVPTEEFWGDFGRKTDVLYMLEDAEYHSGNVFLMDPTNERTAPCEDLSNCREAAMVFLHNGNRGCPLDDLEGSFGGGHALLGCTALRLRRMIWRLQQTKGRPATTGFAAFLTFSALCQELDVYGFSGRGTADGHVEWSLHPLDKEHSVEHNVANKEFDQIDVDMRDWPEDAWIWPWFQQNVRTVKFVDS